MNILEVKDLCKTYIVNKRQNNVLKNVSFTVEEGEMVAVMGHRQARVSQLFSTPFRVWMALPQARCCSVVGISQKWVKGSLPI